MSTIIAIDGYAGSGKTTVARMLSDRLGFYFLDTGIMYRIVALWLFEGQISMEDKKDLLLFLENSSFSYQGGVLCVNDRPLPPSIHAPHLFDYVMKVAEDRDIRSSLVRHQRQLTECQDMILVGRDVTSVVVPHAHYRYFFKADLKIRSERRYREFLRQGLEVTFETVFDELSQRDKRDSQRENSPLVCLEGVKEIETSCLSQEEVMDLILFDLKKGSSMII